MKIRSFANGDEFAAYRKKSVSRESCPFCGNKSLQDMIPPSWRYGRSNTGLEPIEAERLSKYWRMPCSIRAQRCRKCGGSWIDIFEVRAIDLPPAVKDSDIMNRVYKNPLFCPFDHSKRPLVDKFYTASSGISLLIFCPSCHSTWTERSVIIDSAIIDIPKDLSIEVEEEPEEKEVVKSDENTGHGDLVDYHGEFQETPSMGL